MADYLMVHDGAGLERLRPLLAEAYARRTFLGWQPHLEEWQTTALRYARTYHIDPGEILLVGCGPRTRFSPAAWRTLVGELLVVLAVEMPELPGHLESLARLLPTTLGRQVLEGCGDLTFGLATYRPGLAGFNAAEANRKLLGELRAVDPAQWTASLLLTEDEDSEDALEELHYARDWFAIILALYERVVSQDQAIIFENIHG